MKTQNNTERESRPLLNFKKSETGWKPVIRWLAMLALLSTIDYRLSTALAQGTAFTYQGQLQNGGALASGTFNLTFALFTNSAGGTAVAGPETNNGVGVSNGLFTVVIDFGAGPWNGVSNWLEIAVETNGAGSFTTLAPRQEVTPTPYAIFANTASNLSGTLPTTQLNGTIIDTQLLHDAVTVNPGPGLSGGGRVLLGNTIVLTNTGVLSVTGNADVTATTASGAVTLGDTATNTDTPNTIVKRDGSGSFSADNVTLDGVLDLPGPGSVATEINAGGSTLINADTNSDFFAGVGAGPGSSGNNNTGVGADALNVAIGSLNTAVGSQTLFANNGGGNNTAVGALALTENTTGSYNTATGAGALGSNLGGQGNAADGYFALQSNTSGDANTAVGSGAMLDNTNGTQNTAVGNNALFSNLNGSNNTASGYTALSFNGNGDNNTAVGAGAVENHVGGGNTGVGANAFFCTNDAGGPMNNNTAIGANSLANMGSGDNNTAVGWGALNNLAGGSQNIALGYRAGQNVLTGGGNIEIGNDGNAGEDDVIRIGTKGTQTSTFIAGISGVTISPAGAAVFVNSAGELGTVNSSRRYKEDIQDMGEQSDVLLSLRPVAFRYKHELDPVGTPQFGLIAEEVEKVAPELVLRDDSGKIYSVRYEQINAMLLNEFLKQHRTFEEQHTALQGLSEKVEGRSQKEEGQIEELKVENAQLQQKNESMAKRLEALEQIIFKQSQIERSNP